VVKDDGGLLWLMTIGLGLEVTVIRLMKANQEGHDFTQAQTSQSMTLLGSKA